MWEPYDWTKCIWNLVPIIKNHTLIQFYIWIYNNYPQKFTKAISARYIVFFAIWHPQIKKLISQAYILSILHDIIKKTFAIK